MTGTVMTNVADPTTNEATVRGLIDALTSPSIAPEVKAWTVGQNLPVDGVRSGSLFDNHAHQDWREEVKRITLPMLVIAARGSIVPVAALEWAAGQIPDAHLKIFEADEGGSHFMFIENPVTFNAILGAFLE